MSHTRWAVIADIPTDARPFPPDFWRLLIERIRLKVESVVGTIQNRSVMLDEVQAEATAVGRGAKLDIGNGPGGGSHAQRVETNHCTGIGGTLVFHVR